MMGLWFLASAYGQYVAGKLGAGLSQNANNASNMDKFLTYTAGYRTMALYALAGMVLMLLLYPLVKKLMQNVK